MLNPGVAIALGIFAVTMHDKNNNVNLLQIDSAYQSLAPPRRKKLIQAQLRFTLITFYNAPEKFIAALRTNIGSNQIRICLHDYNPSCQNGFTLSDPAAGR